MQVLRELTHLVRVEYVLDRLPKPCSGKKTRQVKDLFRLLKQSPGLADRELARALFGKTRAANHPPFIALVEEITWASLQETLEPRGRHVNHPTRHELMIRCDRMITLLDTLGGGLSEVQLQLWHKLGNACRKCDYVSLEIECQNRKFKYYTSQQLNERKYAELEKRITQLSVTQQACNQCKSSMLLVRGFLADETPLPEYFSLSSIQNAVDTYPHFDVQVYGGEVLISLAMNQRDYDEAIKRINQVYRNIIDRFPREKDLLIRLSFQKLLCYIALKDYPAGKEAWEELFSLHKKTSIKRARYQAVEAGMLLLLRCERAQDVDTYLTRFTALGGISALSEYAKGRWRAIFSALRLLNLQDNISAPAVESYLNKLNRRHKSFKVHHEDELTVAIMEICCLVVSGNIKKASKNILLLTPFIPQRLSTGSPTYRRTLFLKLLQKSASVNFHPAAIQRKTASLQTKLQKTETSISEEALSNELLSFHSLWLMIISARQ